MWSVARFDGGAGHQHRLEFGHRRHGAGAADLGLDRHHDRLGLLGLELERHRPARRLGGGAETLPELRVVHLDDHAVDVEVQFAAPLLPLRAVGDDFLEALAAAPRIVDGQAEIRQGGETLAVRSALLFAVVAGGLNPLVAGQVQPPPRDVPAVEQSHRSGGRVAGVGVELLAGRAALLVQSRERAPAHVGLSPHQQPGGRPGRQPQRQRADGAGIGGYQIADPTVAPGRGLGQDAVLVEQGQRNPVDLQFAHELELLLGQQPFQPAEPLLELVVVVGVVQGQHGRLVLDLGESVRGLASDPLGRAVGGAKRRVVLFELLQLRHQE